MLYCCTIVVMIALFSLFSVFIFCYIFPASCSDIGYFCWIWKTTGKCVKSSNYAVNKCKKSCNFCPVPTGELPSGG